MDINGVLNNSAVSKCKGIGPRNSAVPSLGACRRSDILYEGPFDILVTDYVYPALHELLRLLRRVAAAILFLDVRGIFVEGPINSLHNLRYVQSDVSSYVPFPPGSYNYILVQLSNLCVAELAEESSREWYYRIGISSLCRSANVSDYKLQGTLFLLHRYSELFGIFLNLPSKVLQR